MKFRIKHISFLENNERSISKCTISGRFLAKSKYFGTSSARPKPLTAFEFVTLPVIAESDPVLTLHNGNKMRVYLGGDPFYMVVETQSIIEVHDSEAEANQVSKRPSLIARATFNLRRPTVRNFISFEFPYQKY